jgi:hypothetical protein
MENGPSCEVVDLTGSDEDAPPPPKKQKTITLKPPKPAARKSNGKATTYLIALTWPSASESAVLTNYLQALQEGVDGVSTKVREHCFQRAETRHVSIDQVELTPAQADELSYQGIAAPPTLAFGGLQVNGNYAGLRLDDASRAAVMGMVEAMGEQHRLTVKHGVTDETAHVSLLRKRWTRGGGGAGPTKDAFEAGGGAVEGMVVGAVEGGLRVVIKKRGETPWSDARGLFSGT